MQTEQNEAHSCTHIMHVHDILNTTAHKFLSTYMALGLSFGKIESHSVMYMHSWLLILNFGIFMQEIGYC